MGPARPGRPGLAAAVLAGLTLSHGAHADILDEMLSRMDLSFEVTTLEGGTASHAATAIGLSNGVPFHYEPLDRWGAFRPFTNDEGGQVFSTLPGEWEDLHVTSATRLTFDRPVAALLVATANDNGTGDGFDFGIVPVAVRNLSVDGSFMRADSSAGTLALLVAPTPMRVWESTGEDGIDDGIDLVFFVIESLETLPAF